MSLPVHATRAAAPRRRAGHGQFTERLPAVDEEAAAGHEDVGQTLQRLRTSGRMATIEGAHADGEGDVVASLAGFELELRRRRNEPSGDRR
jgi:hypothetical protein